MADTSVAARPRVAITLAAIAGWVDAVGFLVLFGLFTAHLRGNTARLGVELRAGQRRPCPLPTRCRSSCSSSASSLAWPTSGTENAGRDASVLSSAWS